MSEEQDNGVRLSKLIAARGLASRREAEAWISEGRVSVNGHVVDEVVSVDPEVDHIRVDGRPLPPEPPKVYFLIYKPKGCITSREDPEGRPSVLDLVQHLRPRVEAVGRLDFDTEGALLLTNDGELAHRLTHPSRKVPKRYLAKVYRVPDAEDLKKIEQGIFLEDGKTAPAKARIAKLTDTGNAWLEITVTEGKNRLVRRMLAQIGHPVAKLRRESFATLSITGLERGQVRPLTGEEVRRIKDISEGVRPQRAGRKKGEGFAKAKPKKARFSRKTKPRSRG